MDGDFLQVLSQEFGHRLEATWKDLNRPDVRNFQPNSYSGKDLPRNIIAILCDNHLSTLKTNPHSLNTSKWLAIFFPWVKPLS